MVEVGGREDEFEELSGLVLSLGGVGTEGGVGIQGVGVHQGDVEVQEGLVVIDLHQFKLAHRTRKAINNKQMY